MKKDELVKMAQETAAQWVIEASLFCALVEQESNWNPYAVRYEPAFYRKYVKAKYPDNTEGYCRSMSWGLCQVMGEVAREMGFLGYLPELCEPSMGLSWGAHFFAQKLKDHRNVTHALLAWNGGSNLDYPSQVLARKVNYV